jgi:hypothetical protein
MRTTLAIAATLLALTACTSDDPNACPGHRIIEADGSYYVEATADGTDALGPVTLDDARAFCATL